MKKINLTINNPIDKKNEPLIEGKLYFWERVEIEIKGLEMEDPSLVRAALYDDETQVLFATGFDHNADGNIFCEILLRTEALQNSLMGTKPNRSKNFTFYFWNGYQEEVSFVGTIPIYNNPYIQDELSPEVTINSNVRIQYSVDGNVWEDDVIDGARYIRFSMDAGVSWEPSFCVVPNVNININLDDFSNSDSSSISMDDMVFIRKSNGKNSTLSLGELTELVAPELLIIE